MNYFLPWHSTSTMNGSFMHLWSENKKTTERMLERSPPAFRTLSAIASISAASLCSYWSSMEKVLVSSQGGKDCSGIVLVITHLLPFFMEIQEKAFAVQVCHYCFACCRYF